MLADVLVGGIRQLWLLLFLLLLLTGCDFGKKEREAAEAIYKANAEAAKQCEAKLRGLKRVPIAGTGGRLFLDAERLPMWTISRGFRLGDECAAAQLGWESQAFYWTKEKIIPEHIWLWRDGQTLIEAAKHKDWVIIHANVYLGTPESCERSLTYSKDCRRPLSDKEKIGVIRLKNYPVDAWPLKFPDGITRYSLALLVILA